MLDVSWGEIAVLVGVGVAVTGRRDLPAAFRYAGSHVGRIVGLMQGARARADQFAAHNELRQLQNELRSGLRELDQVKTELAVAASSHGMIGRGLGATVPSANRQQQVGSFAAAAATTTSTASSRPVPEVSKNLSATSPTMTQSPAPTSFTTPMQEMPHVPSRNLAPLAQTMRATAELEWEKQGIGYISRAEQGAWLGTNSSGGSSGGAGGGGMGGKTGSELLENIIRQNLIFDQYDRVVGEQEEAVQQRIDSIREKNATKSNNEVAAREEQQNNDSRKDKGI